MFSRSVRMCALLALVSAPLLMGNKGCGESHSVKSDGGTGNTGGTGGDTTCEPKDCEGMPIPAIACADGPTLTVCELGSDGKCHAQIRCGAPDGGAGTGGTSGGSTGGGTGSVGKTCGGLAALTCASGLFCNLETAAGGTGCKGVADASGVCEKKPDVCPEIYAPVCGCNLRSYSSACDAHGQGASVLHEGLCTADECTQAGGRAVYSNGASVPTCKTGEESFQIPGIEPAICCVP